MSTSEVPLTKDKKWSLPNQRNTVGCMIFVVCCMQRAATSLTYHLHVVGCCLLFVGHVVNFVCCSCCCLLVVVCCSFCCLLVVVCWSCCCLLYAKGGDKADVSPSPSIS